MTHGEHSSEAYNVLKEPFSSPASAALNRFKRSALTALLLCPLSLTQASDHSDAPHSAAGLRQDANLTDLHAFVSGENLVIALSSNPAVPPSATTYVFPSDVTFEIKIDVDSKVSPYDPDKNGGTILRPDKIQEEVTYRIRFDGNGNPNLEMDGSKWLKWIKHQASVVNFFTGLRDDPFIRGPRQGRNVGSIVLEVPLKPLVKVQDTLLIWATSKVDEFDGPFQELAGRSLRSMFPENDGMNQMPPEMQLAQMGKMPDVMIYNTSRPALFPNGRALTDDVVDMVGDARVLGNDAPFPSGNDVPFLSVFPFLSPPHPPRP
jgi:hypothetical protein